MRATQGPILRPIQRLGKLGKRSNVPQTETADPNQTKDPKFVYLSIDECGSHVGDRKTTFFRCPSLPCLRADMAPVSITTTHDCRSCGLLGESALVVLCPLDLYMSRCSVCMTTACCMMRARVVALHCCAWAGHHA